MFSVFNVRSLRNKTTQILELLIENSIDLCCLSETWLRKGDGAIVNEFLERGYGLHHNPREGRGGGTAIAYKKHLKVTKQHCRSYLSFEITETLLRVHKQLLRVCSVYRSPSQSTSIFLEEFENYLYDLNQKSGKPLLCGDFNFHLENKDDTTAARFENLYTLLGFKQHVQESTHVHGGMLDIVLTPEDFVLNDINVIEESGTKSDHLLVKFNVPLSVSVDKLGASWVEKDFRDYDKINPDNFRTDILNSPLCDPTCFSDMDTTVNLFNSNLVKLLDKHAPNRKRVFRSDQEQDVWWNSDCQNSRKLRRRAERKFKKYRSPDNRKQYKLSCEKTSRVVDAVRNRYYKKKLDLADSKQKHSIIKRLLGNSIQHQLPSFSDDDAELASEFQTFFNCKVNSIYQTVEEQQNDVPSSYASAMPTSSCVTQKSSFNEIDESELISIISSMTSKTCLLDPVPTWMVKQYLHELLPILLYIVNLSLSSGEFPSKLKSSIVTPLLKSPEMNSDNLKSYRPVSNLSFLSKLIEKCAHQQLIEYLDCNELFCSLQSGYRKYHSCETAITKVHNDLLSYSDGSSHNALLVLLDLSAAFDTLNHRLLLKILTESFGFNGTVLKWFESYLSQRSFRVKINGSLSGNCYITIGIPQGSILGPLLFILFTKDLQLVARKHGFMFHCYADDCQIYLCFKALPSEANVTVEKLEKCLSEIKHWMTMHFLKLNEEKTEALALHPFYGQSKLVDQISFNGADIAITPTAKSLGIHFDCKLSFQHQVNDIVRTCNYRLKNMIRIGSKLQPSLKQIIFQSYIMNKMDYCNSVYAGLNQSLIDKLQSVQNAGARFVGGIFGRSWRQSGSMLDLLSSLHYLPVSYRTLYKICLLCFKCIHNMAPKYLKDLINISEPSAQYCLRRNCDRFLLVTPHKPRYQKMENAFNYAAPTTWNNLPYRIRSIQELSKFKVALKTYFYIKAFGSENTGTT